MAFVLLASDEAKGEGHVSWMVRNTLPGECLAAGKLAAGLGKGVLVGKKLGLCWVAVA